MSEETRNKKRVHLRTHFAVLFHDDATTPPCDKVTFVRSS